MSWRKTSADLYDNTTVIKSSVQKSVPAEFKSNISQGYSIALEQTRKNSLLHSEKRD